MKRLKFWLAGALFAALAVVMAINLNLKYGATAGRGDFILNNVEALAQGEGGLEQDCIGSGTITCGSGVYKVRVTR